MITFREYLREIEKYTDQNLLDQVVAHSTYILSIYPNSVDALRYLGQAYLEEKKFIDAADCFEKIISFIPDDFVSHIGLTSIKEEDRDLDTAIYHMEMAFDTQPSNNIVQDELKRLINKRDGALPSKINLSKGALIRMYMKGDLLQQSLNEIESAISTSPNRIDLQVLLAQVYYLSNLKVQAAETCNQIVERLPYCVEPNQILFDIYFENGLMEQANIVKERLVAVNPYYQYLDAPRMTIEEISDEKVELERFNYTSAFSAGIEDFLPPHISSQSAHKTETVIPKGTLNPDKFTSVLEKNIDSIPDFMSNAGWEVSENPGNEPPEAIYDEIETTVLLPAEKSKLPDWLENFQISNEFTEKKSTSLPEEPLGIIRESDYDQNVISNIDLTPIKNLSSINEVEMTNDTPQTPLPKDDSSDWMSQFFDEAKNSSSESDEDKALPEWLKSFDEKEPDEEVTAKEEVPDWLKSLDSEIVSNDKEPKPISEESQILEKTKNDEPDWLRSLVSDDSIEEKADSALTPAENMEETNVNLQYDESDETSFSFIDEIRDTETLLNNSGITESENLTSEESNTVSSQEIENNDFFKSLETQSTEIVESSASIPESLENVVPDWVKTVLSDTEESPLESFDLNVSTTVITESPLDLPLDTPEPLIETTGEINVNQEAETIDEPLQGAITQEASEELLEWLRGISPDNAESQPSEEEITLPDFEDQEGAETINESIERLNESSDNFENPESSSMVIEETEMQLEPTPIDASLPEDFLPLPDELNEIGKADEIDEASEPELQVLTEPVSQIDPLEKLRSLLSEGEYSEIASLLLDLTNAGIESDKILNIFSDIKADKSEEFDFLQLFGDTLASFNLYDEAMDIYTQAEQLLK